MKFNNYEEYKQFITKSWERGFNKSLLKKGLTVDLKSEDYYDGEGTRMLNEVEYMLKNLQK